MAHNTRLVPLHGANYAVKSAMGEMMRDDADQIKVGVARRTIRKPISAPFFRQYGFIPCASPASARSSLVQAREKFVRARPGYGGDSDGYEPSHYHANTIRGDYNVSAAAVCMIESTKRREDMPAFFIAQVKVKDGNKFQAYVSQVKPILAEFGAEGTMRGKAMGSIAGQVTHDDVAVVKFPDMQKLEAAFASAEYQAIIPLRDEGADITIVKYEQSA
jgi:uncharacterized protein (DUF1330 family)